MKGIKVVIMHRHIVLMSVNYTPLFLLEQIFKCFLSQLIQDLILFLFELLFIGWETDNPEDFKLMTPVHPLTSLHCHFFCPSFPSTKKRHWNHLTKKVLEVVIMVRCVLGDCHSFLVRYFSTSLKTCQIFSSFCRILIFFQRASFVNVFREYIWRIFLEEDISFAFSCAKQ